MRAIFVVRLERGFDCIVSFDLDSQWHFALLDSVEPAGDLNCADNMAEDIFEPPWLLNYS